MNENKIVFKLNKHKKLWEVMPDYILKIVRESNGEGNMGEFVSLAKHRALVDLFPKEGYVVYDCFACQFTKNYEELYLDEVDEKCCKYCPLDWKDGIQCGFRGNPLYVLEHLNPKKLVEERVRSLCKKISETPVKGDIETE
jgi:hypothetical protein